MRGKPLANHLELWGGADLDALCTATFVPHAHADPFSLWSFLLFLPRRATGAVCVGPMVFIKETIYNVRVLQRLGPGPVYCSQQ